MLKGQNEILAYYKQFRAPQMESFARFVLTQGYGACTPNGTKNAVGAKIAETWQACGRRLFGDAFIAVMARVVSEHLAGHAAPAVIAAPLPDPDF